MAPIDIPVSVSHEPEHVAKYSEIECEVTRCEIRYMCDHLQMAPSMHIPLHVAHTVTVYSGRKKVS